MDEPSFPQWLDLLDDIKLTIISMLDYESRKILRSCSRKDKMFVDRFPNRKQMEMQCGYRTSSEKWFCAYHCTDEHPDPDVPMFTYNEDFENCEEAYDCMKNVIYSAETVTALFIGLNANSIITLHDDKRKLVNLKFIEANFIGGGNNNGEKLKCYRDLFSQVKPRSLKSVIIFMNEFENNNPKQNDDLFDVEKTFLKLESFDFEGSINDEQLLGVRTNQASFFNCSLITPSGLVQFIQKQLSQPPPSLHFYIHRISSELQFYLFGALYHEYHRNEIRFLLNVPGSSLGLLINFISQHAAEDNDDDDDNNDNNDNALYDPVTSIFAEIELIEFEFFHQNNRSAVNTKALEVCPSLNVFISAISEVLPPGFILMRDLENQ